MLAVCALSAVLLAPKQTDGDAVYLNGITQSCSSSVQLKCRHMVPACPSSRKTCAIKAAANETHQRY